MAFNIDIPGIKENWSIGPVQVTSDDDDDPFSSAGNAIKKQVGSIGNQINRELGNLGGAAQTLVNPITRTLGNGLQNPGDALAGIGNGLKENFGSAAYLLPDPLTGIPGAAAIGDDFKNIDNNKKQAQADEDAARERAGLDAADLKKLREGQIDFAHNLANNARNNEQGLLGAVAGGNRRMMAEAIHSAKDHSRGLVGSGFQKKSQAESRSKAAADTYAQQSQIHQMTQDQINEANDLAINLGLQIGGVQQNQADQYYQMAIQNMNQRNSALGQLGAGVGGVVGSALSSRPAYSNPYSTPDTYGGST